MNRLLSICLTLVLSACSQDEPASEKLDPVGGCDAAMTSCEIEHAGNRISLSLGPGVKPLVPFPVNLSIDAPSDVEAVVISFQMKGMEMGLNRYRLTKKEGRWQGIATLPVCTTSRMDWVAELEYVVAGERQAPLNFSFTTQ